MKRPVIALFSCLSIAQGFSQGSVSFLNGSAELGTRPDRLVRFACANTPGNVFGTNGAPAVGTNILLQLRYGSSTATESDLVPTTGALGKLRVSSTGVPGVWAGGGSHTFSSDVTFDMVLNLQVRAWDVNYGATYEAATGGIRGKSAIFTYTVPHSTDPSAAFHMTNFQGLFLGPPCASPPASISGDLAGSGFRITLAGQAGTRSQIEASTNLRDWTPLVIITNESGTAQFTDSAIAPPCRFYRVMQLE